MTRTGGCLCGAVRYRAAGEPRMSGLCYCADCRRASGSGFVGFLVYPPGAVTVSGETRPSRATSIRGTDAVRHHCAACGSLVYGGEPEGDGCNVYAGSLDDPADFAPTIALFVRDRAAWAPLAPGLVAYETMPG